MIKSTFETARGVARWKLSPYTPDQIRSLPASVALVDAANALGLSREQAYQQARRGELEYGDQRVPVKRVGDPYRVRLCDLMQVLGIEAASVMRDGASAEGSAA